MNCLACRDNINFIVRPDVAFNPELSDFIKPGSISTNLASVLNEPITNQISLAVDPSNKGEPTTSTSTQKPKRKRSSTKVKCQQSTVTDEIQAKNLPGIVKYRNIVWKVNNKFLRAENEIKFSGNNKLPNEILE